MRTLAEEEQSHCRGWKGVKGVERRSRSVDEGREADRVSLSRFGSSKDYSPNNIQHNGSLHAFFTLTNRYSIVPASKRLGSMDIHEEFTKWVVRQGIKTDSIKLHKFEENGLGMVFTFTGGLKACQTVSYC